MTKAFWKIVGYAELRPGALALMPSDSQTGQMLKRFGRGTVISTSQPRRPRNEKHHRKFFALLGLVWEGTNLQDRFPVRENLLDALKHELGYVETFATIKGEILLKPKSIAFESMPQDQFEEFYDAAVEIIVTQLVPGLNRRDLERQVDDLLQGKA